MSVLFEIVPAALVYPRSSVVPMHEMRCRECHKRKPINGGGSTGDYQYAICSDCFRSGGDLGKRARRAGVHDRELRVVEEVAA